MNTEKHANGGRETNNIWMLIGLLAITAWNATSAHAQEETVRPVIPPEVSMTDLRRAPGVLLVEGRNVSPIGPLKVRTYRLEEVKLPQPIELGSGESRVRLDSAFRLTITGESFPPGAYTIYLDDEPLGSASFNGDELSIIIYGLLPNEGSISVSRDTDNNRDWRTTLPERMQLPERLRSQHLSANDKKNTVRMRRIASSPFLRDQPGIEILLTGNATYPIRNEILIVQIGTQEFQCGPRFNGDPHTLVCHLTEEEFEKLQDGDTIRAKYGHGLTVPSYQRFGRLDKKLLEE